MAVFGLLLLAALFVLLATPVAINITPSPETRSVQGFPPAIPFGQRLLVLPGTYRVLAKRAGYRPLQATLKISGGGFQEFAYRLQELPGRLRIRVAPAVAFHVRVDGTVLEPDAAGVVELERGVHQLRIETERYLPVTRELEVSGRGLEQTLAVDLQPAWAEVQVTSRPPGAEVRVDGVLLGTTPLAAELLQGERTLQLALAGHKPASLQRTIIAGIPVTLDDIELQPADGRLVLESNPPGATVTIDGVYRGTTPLNIALAANTEHVLRLARPGYEMLERRVTLVPDTQESLTLDLPQEYGIVFVTTRPADASLAVDGKPLGAATRRLRLTTRAHTLEFSKPGYVTQTVNVTPRAGISQNLDITLKTPVQARAEAMPAMLSLPSGPVLRLVRPAGSLSMGASRREAGRRANESRRLVRLMRAFYLGVKEISNAEYRRFKPEHRSGSAEGVSLDGDSQPVVNVSWDDAARYCNWLSARERLPAAYREAGGSMVAVQPLTTGYRLPTEAEWAYVARVQARETQARYPWEGEFPPTSVAGNYADARIADTLAGVVPGYDDGYRATAPVGSFAARPPGFHDLGGNVAEWTHDFYAVYPGMAEQPVTDPAGPASGEHHVVRGSSWRQGSITELRLSYRDYSRTPRDDLGFRIARYAH
jgi:formylglycine-generating enzyme required for sulfatase activity